MLEAGLAVHRKDLDLKIAYAKALTAAGRFGQAMNVADDAIDPASPDWNALLVKGAILDQNGKNAEARAIYTQALLIAPNEASLEANMGLSFAMTNDLDKAEQHLRKAVTMRGASSQIRQNLALVVGLQGRFEESPCDVCAGPAARSGRGQHVLHPRTADAAEPLGPDQGR